ncbi:MAG: hypothetical protein NZ898_05370 [Myxococcota bacterium]|nr:hypothetical protein [Myxococcota bacterium]
MWGSSARITSTVLAMLGVGWAVPFWARAQPEADPTVVRDRAVEVASRLEREIACLSGLLASVQRVQRLLEEARAQGQSATGQARLDAQQSIRSLEQRLAELERHVAACRQPWSPPPAPVEAREAPLDPAAQRVAQPEGTTRQVEGPGQLLGNIRIVRGEQVDGLGRVEADSVRAVMRGAGPAIETCLSSRGGQARRARGILVVTFAIDPAGSVRFVSTEGSTVRRPGVQSCLRRAFSAARSRTPALGGDAVFSYVLRLGFESDPNDVIDPWS